MNQLLEDHQYWILYWLKSMEKKEINADNVDENIKSCERNWRKLRENLKNDLDWDYGGNVLVSFVQ